MSTYNIELKENGTLLKISWGEQATNDLIVQDADARLHELQKTGELKGGPLIRVNGPASLPVAMVISHHLLHLYETVAVFDPKLGKYVVVSAHGGPHTLGNLID